MILIFGEIQISIHQPIVDSVIKTLPPIIFGGKSSFMQTRLPRNKGGGGGSYV